MGVETATLTVKVVTLGSDDEEVADSAERLHRELLTFDTDSLQPVESGSQAPDGSKGVVAVVTAFLVRVSGSTGVRSVISGLRDWVSRTGYSVEITIDGDTLTVSRATAGQQEDLVRAFLDRHAPAGP